MKIKNEEKPAYERCPWYTAVGRILTILGMTLFLYAIFLLLLNILLTGFEETLGWRTWVNSAMQNHPTATIVLLIAGYLVLSLCFVSLMAYRLKRSLFEK